MKEISLQNLCHRKYDMSDCWCQFWKCAVSEKADMSDIEMRLGIFWLQETCWTVYEVIFTSAGLHASFKLYFHVLINSNITQLGRQTIKWWNCSLKIKQDVFTPSLHLPLVHWHLIFVTLGCWLNIELHTNWIDVRHEGRLMRICRWLMVNWNKYKYKYKYE